MKRQKWKDSTISGMQMTQERGIMKPALTTGDVARYCSVSLSTVFRWVREGILDAYTTPGGHHRILVGEFRAFLERNSMPIDEFFFAGTREKKHVLIVDNDPHFVKHLTQALNDYHAQLEIASAGDDFEAGMLITSFRPHLVILNPMMPCISGFQICERLRTHQDTANMKILAVTGFDDSKSRERVLASGIDDYVEMPLDAEEFARKVTQLLVTD